MTNTFLKDKNSMTTKLNKLLLNVQQGANQETLNELRSMAFDNDWTNFVFNTKLELSELIELLSSRVEYISNYIAELDVTSDDNELDEYVRLNEKRRELFADLSELKLLMVELEMATSHIPFVEFRIHEFNAYKTDIQEKYIQFELS